MSATVTVTEAHSQTTRRIGKCRKCRTAFTQLVRPGGEHEAFNWYYENGTPVSEATICCGRGVVFNEVRGTMNTKIVCNAKCWLGKSIDCSCECGGANHGKAHRRHAH